jgi:hypothetical protein
VPVAGWILHQLAEQVGPVVGEEEEEGTVAVLLQEVHAAAGPEVGQRARLAADLPVDDHLLVVELVRVAAGLRDPRRESLGRAQVIAEVPLADQPADVAGVAQDPAE